jgi:hypothetical protein
VHRYLWRPILSKAYIIAPAIGVARLGNSTSAFYLEPEAIGGQPLNCDAQGNAKPGPEFVTRFKDAQGAVKRQAARFRIFAVESDGTEAEVTLDSPEVKSISWTVHLANKKAAWFQFSELQGNLLYGPQNSYSNQKVSLRNANVKQADARQKLIIDPGPRTLDGPGKRSVFDKASVPPTYQFASFPGVPKVGDQVKTLGEVMTDGSGRLLVLGGFGVSGGDEPLKSFGGADTWHDDIADGPVSCTLTLKSGDPITLTAWCIVGSPKFAPELVNISTLDDTMYDVAVRHLNAAPHIFASNQFNAAYVADYDAEIRPILERPGTYRWVANVPSMNSFSPPPFDPRDATNATAALRQAYLGLFRDPGPENAIAPGHGVLFAGMNIPLMPLNSGSNSVSDENIDKFMTLTQTQHFFLKQWAAGKFRIGSAAPVPDHIRLSRASMGNCVGNPFCPGIEVTWTTRNPNIYEAPWRIRHRNVDYFKQGLDPSGDETANAEGCEPGDLTKRMAIPWQADFYECSIQFINFTDPKRNTGDDGNPLPPTYYAYWWPPQSPWQVIAGDTSPEVANLNGEPAGLQVMYSRGVNRFEEMIQLWSHLGFIVNQSTGPHRELFPYFTEQERAHDKFRTASAEAVAGVAAGTLAAHELALSLSEPQTPVKPDLVAFATSRARGRVPN